MHGLSPARTLGKMLALVTALSLGGGLVAYRQWSALKAAEADVSDPEGGRSVSRDETKKVMLSSSKRLTAAVSLGDMSPEKPREPEMLPSSKIGIAIRREDFVRQWTPVARGAPGPSRTVQTRDSLVQIEAPAEGDFDVPGFRITPTVDKEYRHLYVITELALEKTDPAAASFEVRVDKEGGWAVTPPAAVSRLTDAIRSAVRGRNSRADFSPTYYVYEPPGAARPRKGSVSLGLPSSKSGPALIFEFEEDDSGRVRLRESGRRRYSESDRIVLERESADAVRSYLKEAGAKVASDKVASGNGEVLAVPGFRVVPLWVMDARETVYAVTDLALEKTDPKNAYFSVRIRDGKSSVTPASSAGRLTPVLLEALLHEEKERTVGRYDVMETAASSPGTRRGTVWTASSLPGSKSAVIFVFEVDANGRITFKKDRPYPKLTEETSLEIVKAHLRENPKPAR